VTESNENRAKAAGRGGIAVLGAKAFFIVSGLVQQTLLPRAIGLAGYGALSRVLAVVNVLNNVVVASSVQGVSRAVARAGAKDEQALRATLRVHVPIAIALGLLFAASAPAIAAFEGARHIALPLAVVGGVVAVYGMYAPLVGAINGRGQFTRQASLDVTFAVLRTAGLIGLGWFFAWRWGGADETARARFGTLGAAVGFVAAAVCIVPMALRWTGIGRAPAANDPSVPRASSYLDELWPLALAQLFTNAVMQVDITLLGRFLSQGALASGLMETDAAKSADEWVAVYRACQLFAFLPYQLLFSITQVLFPMLARAKAERDDAAVRTYVARGARLGAIACGLMVTIIVAMPGSLIAFLYQPPVPARGEATLRLLALGQGAFAMLGIATTVLASLGRERIAAIISFYALTMVAAACWNFVPSSAFGEAQLIATALATCAALGSGLIAATFAVRRIAGGFVPMMTALRVGAALAIAVVGGTHLPHFGKLLAPIAALGIALLYVLFLVVTGELGASDLGALRALAGRRGGSTKS
jgi:stage V sporulation protein B